MKDFRPALIAGALLLAGCAGSGHQTATATSETTWWNPISWSWSSLSPWHWFGASLQVTESGVGAVSGATAMEQQAISDGLHGNYRLRQGMRGEDGNIIHFWQALNSDNQPQIEISGDKSVSRIDVTDADIRSESGVKIGTPFSELYSKAFGACRKGSGADADGVECKAPGSAHISYLFSGKWHGPQALIPADETLKSWTVSKIIWRK